MSITLFNPKTQTFAALTPPINDLPFGELLLLNILIEMHTHTHYLREIDEAVKSSLAPNWQIDEAKNIRTDIVSVST